MNKITLSQLQKFKKERKKITTLTCYDATFSHALNQAKIDAILVGDSIGNVIQGHDSTIPVSIDDLIYHTKCVHKNNLHSFLIADMPFMSYYNQDIAMQNAAKLIQAGAQMIKLEGGKWLAPIIKNLVEKGIPVCAHIGLNPQYVNIESGYKVQGKTQAAQEDIINTALKLEKAGANLIVIECVPSELADNITKLLTIPTIGIGAGPETDGQVLVLYDILGIYGNLRNKSFKFSKVFLDKQNYTIEKAILNYKNAVEQCLFPAKEHTF